MQAIEEEFVAVLEKIAESHKDAVHVLRAKSILQNMGANKKVHTVKSTGCVFLRL